MRKCNQLKGFGWCYDRYRISEDGKVYSGKKVLDAYPNTRGYLQVRLYGNNKHKKVFVHRLVALAFLPRNGKGEYLNHINEVCTDNRVENLEWCTMKYNNSYGTKQKRKVENSRLLIASVDCLTGQVETWTHDRLKRFGYRYDLVSCKCRTQADKCRIYHNKKWYYIK